MGMTYSTLKVKNSPKIPRRENKDSRRSGDVRDNVCSTKNLLQKYHEYMFSSERKRYNFLTWHLKSKTDIH